MIEYVNENAEGAVLLTGFDNCIIGVVEEFGNGNRVLYSKEKIIQKLMEDMNEETSNLAKEEDGVTKEQVK